MKFSDASIFFGSQKKGQDDMPLPQQEPSLPSLRERNPLPLSEASRDEILPASPVPIPHLHPMAGEGEKGPVIGEKSRPTRVGQRLGNYQLTRLLGEGGFAEVYLGEHIHLGSQAAIKVLQSQLTREDIDHFRAEARTPVRLIHPHIVRILDFRIEDRTPFLVMDYAPHGTLRQLHAKGKPVPLATIISYVKQVAEALQFAHNEKIIHFETAWAFALALEQAR